MQVTELTRTDPESIIVQQMRRFGERISIFSYHYMPVMEKRPYKSQHPGGYHTTYIIHPVKDLDGPPNPCIAIAGGKNLPVIMDAYERVFLGTDTFIGAPPIQKWTDYSLDTTAPIIAEDVVKAATGWPSNQDFNILRPAVWKSNVPWEKLPHFEEWNGWGTAEFNKRYPELVAECGLYRKLQWNHNELKIKQATEYHVRRQLLEINEIHRGAARQNKASTMDHPWIETSSYQQNIQCPFCGQATSANHPICGNCHRIINAKQLDELEAGMAKNRPRASS